MKVIVVEDNPVYNDYICNLLKKGGFEPHRRIGFPPPRNC